jgi:hypothetical protein
MHFNVYIERPHLFSRYLTSSMTLGQKSLGRQTSGRRCRWDLSDYDDIGVVTQHCVEQMTVGKMSIGQMTVG